MNRRRRPDPDPDQLALLWSEEEIARPAGEETLAEQVENQTYQWQLQLVLAESLMMAALVLVAGWSLHLPGLLILRAAAMVGASSLAAGLLMLGLSTSLLRRVRRLTKGRQK